MFDLIVDGGLNTHEFLQTSQTPEFLHRVLSSPGSEMGVFAAIVQLAAYLSYLGKCNDPLSGAI